MGDSTAIKVSRLTDDEILASNLLMEAHKQMWELGPQRRQKIYQRWEMLHLFTPKMSAAFESNLQRINKKF